MRRSLIKLKVRVTVIYCFQVDETLLDLKAQKHDCEVESLVVPC